MNSVVVSLLILVFDGRLDKHVGASAFFHPSKFDMTVVVYTN